MVDLVLRRAVIEDAASPSDIAVDGGRIVRVAPGLELAGRTEMDLGGHLVLPGLVNPHIHLDKAFVGNLAPSGIMTEGVAQGRRLKQQYTKRGIQARARRVLDLAIRGAAANGRGGLLDFPQYTRPADFRGLKVPDVLLSGDHEEIRRWRRRRALEKTWRKRPDLLENFPLGDEDQRMLEEIQRSACEPSIERR